MLADHITSIFAIKYRNRTALARGIGAERVERDNLRGRGPGIGQGTIRGAQDRPVALGVGGDSIRSLASDHQLTVWSDWKSDSDWAIGLAS